MVFIEQGIKFVADAELDIYTEIIEEIEIVQSGDGFKAIFGGECS